MSLDNPKALDAIGWKILKELQEDGRLTFTELGRRVGLSQPAVSERVKRLEERGIIAGYRAVVDLAALGLGTTAVVRLRTTHEHIAACLKQFAKMPEVIEVLRLTGEDCFFLKVIVPAPSALESIVDTLGRYGGVTTSVVLRSEPTKSVSRALIARA